MVQEFNYSTNELLSNTLEPDQDKYDVLIDGKFENMPVDSPPVLIGGDIYQVLSISGFGYPKSARDNGIQGRVIISFVINDNGEVSDFVTIKSLDPEVDLEILEALKSIDHKWVPAKMAVKNVTVKKLFMMNLQLR